MEKVAKPPERAAVPSRVEPSLKETVPVAVLGVTEAVKTTFWPKLEGLSEDARLVVLTTRFTFWVTGAATLEVKAPLPP